MSTNDSLTHTAREDKLIRWILSCLFFLLALLPIPASAHIGAPEGRSPFLDNDVFLGGGTTWGIIHHHESQWRRVCEESVGEPPNFWLYRPDGRVLLGTSQGLLMTRDYGCTYEQVDESLAMHKVGTVAVPEEYPSHIYVATSSPGGNNAIYRSTNDGDTFDISGLQGLDDFILSMFATKNENNIYASTYSRGEGGVHLYRSTDFGATFQESVSFPENALYITIVGYRQATKQLVLSIIFAGASGGHLYFADEALEEFTPIQAFSSVPTTFVEYGAYEFVLLAFSELVRRVRSQDNSAFESFEDSNARCIVHSSSDDRLWRCGLSYQFGHFLSSLDGDEWDIHIPFLDVIEFQCPEGTIGASRCAYLFTDAGTFLDAGAQADAGPTPDAGSPPPHEDGGTSAGPPEDSTLSCGCDKTFGSEHSPYTGIALSLSAFGLYVWCGLRQRTSRRQQENDMDRRRHTN